MDRYSLAYVSNPRSLGIRAALTIVVTTLVVSFSLPEFVNGRHSWFLGTDDVVTYYHGKEIVRPANCRPRLRPKAQHLGYAFDIDACDVNCVNGETYIGNHAGATSSLFFFLIPLWGVVFDRRVVPEVVLAWAHFSSLAVASFMYHGTRFDEYWRIDRSLCYLFALPFVILELLERVPASGNVLKLSLLAIYAVAVVLFSTGDDLFDEAGEVVSFAILGIYVFFVGARLVDGKLARVAYAVSGLAILLVSYLLLTYSAFEFCHGHAWLGNLAIGHVVAVPGFTLVLASHFLRFRRECTSPAKTPFLLIDNLLY